MNILVIGAGPAGLMAAIQAAEVNPSAKIRLLEQNDRIGRKLLATGNGKCNLSNRNEDHSLYMTGHRETLETVFRQFSFQDTRNFFEKTGIVLKDKSGWLYPMPEQAQPVVSILERTARKAGVTIKTKEHVTGLTKEENVFKVRTETWEYPADRVILTTGGPASAIEGSTMEGMELAGVNGHHIIKPLPALVPLRIKEKEYLSWAGTRMDGTVTLYIDGKKIKSEAGELQFADYGISGIAVFQVSAAAVRACENKQKVTTELDIMPSFTDEGLASFLADRREQLRVKTEEELFTGFLPDRMIKSLIRKKAMTDELYVKRLKHLMLTITGAHSFERAQVVSGGIDLSEVNPLTMESRKVPGMYFAGEILDVCGPCGGYNLQWAWSSGATAGRHAAIEE